MELRILLFQDLIFLYIVLLLELQHHGDVCQLRRNFLVFGSDNRPVIRSVDCWMYGSRKQVVPRNIDRQRQKTVWTLGISENKRDVYFLSTCGLDVSPVKRQIAFAVTWPAVHDSVTLLAVKSSKTNRCFVSSLR